jgi:c-di-GMP-binding flagellar brake protein YcgR
VDRQKLSILFRTVSGGMLENRRKYIRVPLQTEVICLVGSRTIRGVTWNLSQGGMQVEASNLQAKDTVRLSFRLPVSGVSIDAVGTVAWANEKRQGIQFTTLNTPAQQSIRTYIAEVEKD